MDRSVVLPRLAGALQANAFLAIVVERTFVNLPWVRELAAFIPEYSTSRDYQPYDLVSGLTRRGLFTQVGRRETAPVEFAQSIDDYVEPSTRETASLETE